MREDVRDDKSAVGPRQALMQTYDDDPVQLGRGNADAAPGSGEVGPDGGGKTSSSLPQVA